MTHMTHMTHTRDTRDTRSLPCSRSLTYSLHSPQPDVCDVCALLVPAPCVACSPADACALARPRARALPHCLVPASQYMAVPIKVAHEYRPPKPGEAKDVLLFCTSHVDVREFDTWSYLLRALGLSFDLWDVGAARSQWPSWRPSWWRHVWRCPAPSSRRNT